MEAHAIKAAVREVFEEERTSFWVPAEPHYNDHKFVQTLRKIIIAVGAIAITTVVPTAIYIIVNHMADL